MFFFHVVFAIQIYNTYFNSEFLFSSSQTVAFLVHLVLVSLQCKWNESGLHFQQTRFSYQRGFLHESTEGNGYGHNELFMSMPTLQPLSTTEPLAQKGEMVSKDQCYVHKENKKIIIIINDERQIILNTKKVGQSENLSSGLNLSEFFLDCPEVFLYQLQ